MSYIIDWNKERDNKEQALEQVLSSGFRDAVEEGYQIISVKEETSVMRSLK